MSDQSLFKRVGAFWANQAKSGHNGLVLLDECIRKAASADRDWDALARFLSRADRDSRAVKAIILAAFGDNIKYTTDKAHAAGGRFKLGWEGEFALRNTYGVVTQAIADGKSFRAGDLQDALRDQRNEAKPAQADKDMEAVSEMVFKYISKQVKEHHVTSGALLAAVQEKLALAAQKAKAA